VIAFEPIADTVDILAAMIRRARYRHIRVLHAAVSDRAGVLRLNVRVSPATAWQWSGKYRRHN